MQMRFKNSSVTTAVCETSRKASKYKMFTPEKRQTLSKIINFSAKYLILLTVALLGVKLFTLFRGIHYSINFTITELLKL